MTERTKREPWAITTAIGVGVAVVGLLLVLFGTFVNVPDMAEAISRYGLLILIAGAVVGGIGVVLRLLRR